MSFYPQGHGPYRRRRGMHGCGCLIGLVAAVVALIVIGVAIAVAFFLMSPGADFDDPSTPAPSSTGSDWQPSGG
ncbi:hypothetical protein [Brevibacterium luteolum]|uniref:hypothetical protein n=1 Tax=Brevibacterium luteolum TaxID=199591 RepID=UPI001C22E3EB|nr:hypothetical protein [Brevibacterium luteolum]MBU8578918.1 hypothetical protein [Brevibacterium luteolum]